MLVCLCKAVSDRSVAGAIRSGARTVDDVTACTGAGGGCGRCRESIQDAIDMSTGRRPKPRVVLPVLAALPDLVAGPLV
jgi:bacterioferritin-associated ferredoxin